MAKRSPLPVRILLLAVVMVAAACGGDSGGGGEAIADTTAPAAPDTADPDDADQDGVADGDNCPGLFNPDQGDDDTDGIGNACDDSTDITVDCSLGGSLTQEASGSGDGTLTTVCQPLIQGDLPDDLLALGTPILITEDYLIIDLTPAQLAEARDLGMETVVTDTIAGRTPADLIELRIERDPRTALATADPAALSEVEPAAINRVPPEVLAEQPDQVIAAIPDSFWLDAPASTIEIVGRERLITLNPRLIDLDLQLLPVEDGRLRLPDPTTTTATTVTTTTSADADDG